MKTIQLGTSDLHVTRICFGCWQLSPAFWGDIPLPPWEDAIRAAVDAGVNFIDTADAYGEGYAEAQLGNVLHREGLRDQVVLATKFLWRFEGENERFRDTTRDHILRACEASLQRLQTDRIDLYQIHGFDPLTRPEEVASALSQLKEEGKIRWVGVSNLNPEQMRMYEQHFQIVSLQPPYSLLRRGIETQELPYCLNRKMGVMVYSPLFRGLLTGKYDKHQTFSDSRADLPEFTGEKFEQILAALDSLRPLAEGYGLTLAQLAIRWVLTHPAITSAIVGVRTRSHIEGILAAAEGTLDPDDWQRIALAVESA